MRQRIALTGAGPYIGVSTLATAMAMRGYQYVSMSDVLIEEFARSIATTPLYVKKNKAHYRFALQQFGDDSGFSSMDGTWPFRLFRGIDITKPVVVEKMRTNEQAEQLTKLNFDIIALTVSNETRLTRAAQFGVGAEELGRIMEHHVEAKVADFWVDCTYRIDEEGDNIGWLISRIIEKEGDNC